MLLRAWDAAAACCRQGGRLACGGAMGQRPGRTRNMLPMSVTCATSQSKGWLKSQAFCQVRRGVAEEFSGVHMGCRVGRLQARCWEARMCGGAMGQRPGRTSNMRCMLMTCATSQSRGWLKSRAFCQVRRGGGV